MWRVKARYLTFCARCAGQIDQGAWITEVDDAWVHDACPRHEYTGSAPAHRASAKRSNTMATEATAAQQEAPQYATAAQFKKLVNYVKELVADHNRLEERVIQLENYEKTRQRIENEEQDRKARKQQVKDNRKFQGRDATLEAEA